MQGLAKFALPLRPARGPYGRGKKPANTRPAPPGIALYIPDKARAGGVLP